MKLSKVMALGAAGVLLFGTSLFSRDRDNPSWAWTSNGAAAANLSAVAQAPALQRPVWNDTPPAVQDVRAPAAPSPVPQASAPVPEASKAAAVPARRGSAVARSKDRAVDGQFDKLVELLKQDRLAPAVKGQSDLHGDLQQILEAHVRQALLRLGLAQRREDATTRPLPSPHRSHRAP